MLQRNSTNYLNEPYATGGNPVLADNKVLFNDMLGTTQGSIAKNGKYQATNKTAFGAGSKEGFFTGKPHVKGLGSVFLFRNYRPELSKWTSSDPLGYPDGWNNLAYVNNHVTNTIDWQGTEGWTLTSVDNNIPSGGSQIIDDHEVITAYSWTSTGSETSTGTAPTDPSEGDTYTVTYSQPGNLTTYTDIYDVSNTLVYTSAEVSAFTKSATYTYTYHE